MRADDTERGSGEAGHGDALVSVRGLRVWFQVRGGSRRRGARFLKAVDGVDLDVGPGETLGLVGESGCGKTTLGRALLGLEAAEGSVCFRGRPLLDLSEAQWRAFRPKMQMVFQDPYASLNPRMTVVDLVTEGLREQGMGSGARAGEALRLLREVGLDGDALHRYPFEFSGGQRQRISLARAMSLRPAFVVCDEAVSALDISVQAQVLNLLMDLREAHGLAYLLISHDLGVVRHLAHRTAVMVLGRLVEIGPAEAIMTSPRHPCTQALVAAAGARTGGVPLDPGDPPSPVDPPPGCPVHPRCRWALPVCREEAPAFRAAGASRVRCHRYPEEAPP